MNCKTSRKLQKNDGSEEKRRPCEENERGAHSEEKNARCGHTGEKKVRAAKPKMERCVPERYDRSGSERGQHNKHGRMEEEANQLYRRPQMMGQARYEEEEERRGVVLL